jgi:hypothetical protein
MLSTSGLRTAPLRVPCLIPMKSLRPSVFVLMLGSRSASTGARVRKTREQTASVGASGPGRTFRGGLDETSVRTERRPNFRDWNFVGPTRVIGCRFNRGINPCVASPGRPKRVLGSRSGK